MSETPPHHTDHGFRNPWPGFERRGFLDLLKWLLFEHGKTPRQGKERCPELEGIFNDGAYLRKNTTEFTVTWIGHATVLVQMNGLNILVDPVWSERVSPLPFAGPHRYAEPMPAFEDLPRIDVVLITHDHYDHLDKDVIARLGDRSFYIVPLGIGRILGDIGITRRTELDWWDTHTFGGLTFTCTPAQHFSGRGMFDRNRTLWCGWLCRGTPGSLYVAGDTGYFPGFLQIGERYGPIDLACIPIGAYMPRWFMRPVHLDPADAIQAFKDIRGRYLMPIHYGTFHLADDPLCLPILEFRNEIARSGLDPGRFLVLRRGETRIVPSAIR